MSIDESHLSASSHERRNSLEKHLQTRPEMQDLKNRHILLDTNVAPYIPQMTPDRKGLLAYIDRSIQNTREELARQRASDNLKKNLEKRPERGELVERTYPLPVSHSHLHRPLTSLIYVDHESHVRCYRHDRAI